MLKMIIINLWLIYRHVTIDCRRKKRTSQGTVCVVATQGITHIFFALATTRREFLREILYKNIAIIAIQHSKMYFVDTFDDFSHTVE